MSALVPPRGTRLTGPLVISAALHVGALALLATRPAPPAMPPMYEVNLIAAPAGPRAVGNVAPVPTAPEPAAAPSAPPRATSTPAPKAVPVPKAAPPKAVKPVPSKAAPKSAPTTAPTATKAAPSAPAAPATEVPVTKAPPTSTTAGGGPTGDKGTDVATVRTEGTAFPFPGYLQNIVRQIALNFRPRAAGALRCDVAFLIHRDGSVSNVRFVSRSGAYAFDLEAQGAIEAAARSRAFGPLPAGFADDVLPVTFSFDPRLVR